MINKTQEKVFALIRGASFNNFDGEYVVGSLKAHEHLWRGVVMTREGDSHEKNECTVDLINLRDIEDDEWNIDTMFILATTGNEADLATLVASWSADEVDWLDDKEASEKLGSHPAPGRVLRVWWD